MIKQNFCSLTVLCLILFTRNIESYQIIRQLGDKCIFFMKNVNLVRVSVSQFNIFADVKLIECEKLIY